MGKEKPLLIVLTPVRNEAWILPAFLKATSLWADYIIIADQMSTDGSRALYKKFNELTSEGVNEHKCELIIIDNPRKEMHQAATRRLLFKEAQKIEGDKILFAMDADEFLSGNFPETEGWKTILNSEPGDVFLFRWMNLSADATKYSSWEPYYWAAHVSEEVMNGDFPDNFIHEWRLPWPKRENYVYTIEDISFIHFARVNVARQRNKERFYQVSQSAPMDKYSGVAFYRRYHPVQMETLYDMPKDAYEYYQDRGMEVQGLMNLLDEGEHYTISVVNAIQNKGIQFFRKLDVWDAEFIAKINMADPRRCIDKLMHWYLRKTNNQSRKFIIHVLDYILKKVY